MITYKLRLYPNKEQQTKLWKHANKLNWLYNYFLDQRIEAFDEYSVHISMYQQKRELVNMKKSDSDLKEIYSQALQQPVFRLDKTYKAFFRNIDGFPKFRSCKKFFGITYPMHRRGIWILENSVKTRDYGVIKFSKSADIQGNIKQITITTKQDKWYLCVTTDFVKPKAAPPDSIIGIDVGITNIAALSDGTIIRNQNHSKHFDQVINELKSRRDKLTTKGSRRNKFLTKAIQRLYGVKIRKTTDFLHKVSKEISSKFDTIVIEKLDLKKMGSSTKTGLNRELHNSCICQFTTYLKYKANRTVEVNPFNTSKTCNQCGRIHDLPLSKRVMDCSCGNRSDRDVNAANNIICLGRAFLETGRIDIKIQEALAYK